MPLSALAWRFDEGKCGGGPLIFDHGYHLFSLAHYLMGEVERVYAWIDQSPIMPQMYVDAPATIMFQFKAPRRYGVLDNSEGSTDAVGLCGQAVRPAEESLV